MTNFSFNELIKCGNEKYENRDYEGGIDDFSKAIEINPQSEEAFMGRAMLHALRGDIELACMDWNKASELGSQEAKKFLDQYSNQQNNVNQKFDQNSYLSYLNEGKRKLTQGDTKSARNELRKAMILGSKDAKKLLKDSYPNIDGVFNSAINNVFRGIIQEKFDIQGAINEYSIAIDLDPNNIDALFFRGRAKNKLGESSDSVNDLREVIKRDREYQSKENDFNLFNYLLNDDYEVLENVDDLLGNILRLNQNIIPLNSDEYNLRGISKAETKDYQGAIEDTTIAINTCSSSDSFCSDLYVNRANYNDISEKLDYAIKDYSKALEINPKSDRAYFERGIALRNSGNQIKATDDLTECIKLNPENVSAYRARGNIRFNQSDIRNACFDWRRGASLGDQTSIKLVKKHCGNYQKVKHPDTLRNEEELKKNPITYDAFSISLEVISLLFKQNKERNMSVATYLAIGSIEDKCNPEIIDFADNDDTDYLLEIKNETTDIDSLKEFFEDLYCECEDEEEIKQSFSIGSSQSCQYIDKESFISDVNWEMVIYVVQQAWDSSLSEDKMKNIRQIKIVLDKERE